MNVGIIVYSETGHTLEVVNMLATRLRNKHTVTIYRLAYDKARNATSGVPYINGHERLILATPVQGFAPSIPMMEAIKRIENFDGRPVDVVITQYFRYKWLGGTQTIGMLQKAINAAKGIVGIAVNIHWHRRDRTDQINQAIETFAHQYQV